MLEKNNFIWSYKGENALTAPFANMLKKNNFIWTRLKCIVELERVTVQGQVFALPDFKESVNKSLAWLEIIQEENKSHVRCRGYVNYFEKENFWAMVLQRRNTLLQRLNLSASSSPLRADVIWGFYSATHEGLHKTIQCNLSRFIGRE